jgi:glycosyltransferase involved in cell wall biosynthesis
MPKVSIIIPTNNRPRLLVRAIQSVLNQTFQDFEIIVVDDGVKKRSDRVIQEIGDNRIRYIQHPMELGGAAARNTGIKNARGEFIAFLDDDDEWLKQKLEKQIAVFEEAGNDVGVVFCGVKIYDKEGNLLNVRLPNQEGIMRPFERLLHKCFIWTSAIMIRKKLADRGIVFDVNFTKNQEWDLLLRLSKVTDFFSINEALVKINILDEHEHMGGKGNIANIIKGFETLIKKHFKDYKKYPHSLALRYFQLGVLYIENNNIRNARFYFYKAWLASPFNITYLRHFLSILLGRKVYVFLQRLFKRFKK